MKTQKNMTIDIELLNEFNAKLKKNEPDTTFSAKITELIKVYVSSNEKVLSSHFPKSILSELFILAFKNDNGITNLDRISDILKRRQMRHINPEWVLDELRRCEIASKESGKMKSGETGYAIRYLFIPKLIGVTVQELLK